MSTGDTKNPDGPDSPDDPSGPERRAARRTGQFLQMDFLAPDPALDQLTLLERMRTWCNVVLDRRGTIASLVAASRVVDTWGEMEHADRVAFYAMLDRHFCVDQVEVEEAISAFMVGQYPRAQELARLSMALDSPRLQLMRQFNGIPPGIKFLVDLRADVDARLKQQPELWLMEFELSHLLRSWFNMGFLRLERITWESPAALLEKLVEYEAVHAIASWSDLKRRLQADRACYAFLHQSMPAEPVIFVEVALVRGLAASIHELIDPQSVALEPQRADTAIFYSITNAQRGLRGIPFGNLLIKQVTARLRAEMPNLDTFATLSPIPRLREEYIDPAVADGSIARHFDEEEGAWLCRLAQADDVAGAVGRALQREWHEERELAEALRPGMLRAARAYLTEVQHRGRVACPVGHFHASNGAKLGRINWLGNCSRQGLSQSAGMMVNYLYEPHLFEEYQAEYGRSGRLPVDELVLLL